MYETVAYAVVEDIPVSWHEYLPDDVPRDGLILRVAGPTDEGVRAIEIWDSEEAWRRSQDDSRVPTATAGSSTRRELRVAHLSAPPPSTSKERR
jgi:hypothetical protein